MKLFKITFGCVHRRYIEDESRKWEKKNNIVTA